MHWQRGLYASQSVRRLLTVVKAKLVSRINNFKFNTLFHSVVDAADSPRPPRLSKETCVCFLLKKFPQKYLVIKCIFTYKLFYQHTFSSKCVKGIA